MELKEDCILFLLDIGWVFKFIDLWWYYEGFSKDEYGDYLRGRGLLRL